jgi:hypothetical protein
MTTTESKKTPKPCPRCGSPAGAGNGGSLCQCKKGKQAAKPAPCDAPIKSGDKGAVKGDCGCQKK